MDRNLESVVVWVAVVRSLSARRAWIEMLICVSWTAPNHRSLSARRAWIEMAHGKAINVQMGWSLSARRAWIEIDNRHTQRRNEPGSLSARRAWIEMLTDDVSTGGKIGRSPQGERG